MSVVFAILVGFSILLTVQALYTVYMMLYTWDRPDAYAKAKAPERLRAPEKTFTVLLPARHEEEVIQMTIERVVRANYPQDKIQVMVICESGDEGTIAKAEAKVAELRAEGINNAKVVTFNDKPINKPHGLNVGLRQAQNEVVTIFDAEDEIHPEIFNIVNTIMLEENIRVVQCGVQLMNYDSSWYSTLNVLEYFFWFKSRLHFQAELGMVTLGGNTVFFARDLIEKVGGWDETNLTEDADIGIRVSLLGEQMRIMYDDRYVTQEETPPSLGQFIKQRTRWNQGFLQTLRKGDWRKFPGWQQPLLALYTLAFPTVQALLGLYVPVSLWMMVAVRLPVLTSILLLLPTYSLAAHFLVSVVGLYEFAGAHRLRVSWHTPLIMGLSYLPYQWVLAYAALRATLREMRGINTWEKTKHIGAHRQRSSG